MTSREHHNPTTSEAWRLECEARYVLSMPKEQRAPYLRRVGQNRGKAARERLEAEVRRQYAAGKTSQPRDE